MSASGTIRVILVDDHEVVRRGVAEIINAEADIDDEAGAAAVLAGASGYVLKDIRGQKLIEGIRHVAAGKSLIDEGMARRIVVRLQARPAATPADALSAREREVLDLIADGMTNRQIGEVLGLAEKTVKNYVSGLLRKLNMERRTQAAVFGSELRGG